MHAGRHVLLHAVTLASHWVPTLFTQRQVRVVREVSACTSARCHALPWLVVQEMAECRVPPGRDLAAHCCDI